MWLRLVVSNSYLPTIQGTYARHNGLFSGLHADILASWSTAHHFDPRPGLLNTRKQCYSCPVGVLRVHSLRSFLDVLDLKLTTSISTVRTWVSAHKYNEFRKDPPRDNSWSYHECSALMEQVDDRMQHGLSRPKPDHYIGQQLLAIPLSIPKCVPRPFFLWKARKTRLAMVVCNKCSFRSKPDSSIPQTLFLDAL